MSKWLITTVKYPDDKPVFGAQYDAEFVEFKHELPTEKELADFMCNNNAIIINMQKLYNYLEEGE